MKRLLLMIAVAGTAAFFAARWAIRQNELAEDEAARADWENEGGATSPLGVG